MANLMLTERVEAISNDVTLSEDGKFEKKLELWYNMADEMAQYKAVEMELRKEIFDRCFPNPVEGSGNKYELQGGWIVQAKYPYTRKVDVAILTNLQPKLDKAGVPSSVIKWTPTLVMGEYNKLPDKQKAILDQAIEVKPGSPALEVKLPKRR